LNKYEKPARSGLALLFLGAVEQGRLQALVVPNGAYIKLFKPKVCSAQVEAGVEPPFPTCEFPVLEWFRQGQNASLVEMYKMPLKPEGQNVSQSEMCKMPFKPDMERSSVSID
jgi:hypothetical protein